MKSPSTGVRHRAVRAHSIEGGRLLGPGENGEDRCRCELLPTYTGTYSQGKLRRSQLAQDGRPPSHRSLRPDGDVNQPTQRPKNLELPLQNVQATEILRGTLGGNGSWSFSC